MTRSSNIRTAAVAGTFYPADRQELRREIEGYLDNVKLETPLPRPAVIVEPHAGYAYSGQVAAYGYKLLQNHPVGTVVIISPSHMEHFPFASVFEGEAYETPLGRVPIDKELARQLVAASPHVQFSPHGHVQPRLPNKEHALEVQLPFLQVVLGNFAVVPVVMGEQSWELCRTLGESLASHLAPDDLIVASSDLSHFYRYDAAREKDARFLALLQEMNPQRLYDAVRDAECEACGAGPVVASMIAARHLDRPRCEVLSASNSGDVTGVHDSVVGYASAALFGGRDDGGRIQ